jgi:hypothetical protein
VGGSSLFRFLLRKYCGGFAPFPPCLPVCHLPSGAGSELAVTEQANSGSNNGLDDDGNSRNGWVLILPQLRGPAQTLFAALFTLAKASPN